MSYEDLQQARTQRTEKEAAKVAKGKGRRGRKLKEPAAEAEGASANREVRGRKRILHILKGACPPTCCLND